MSSEKKLRKAQCPDIWRDGYEQGVRDALKQALEIQNDEQCSCLPHAKPYDGMCSSCFTRHRMCAIKQVLGVGK